MKSVLSLSVLILTLSVTISPVWAINRVLRLDGYGDYVSIPDWSELRGGPDVVKTIEAMFNAENSTVSERKSIGGAIVGKALDGAQKDWVIQIRDGKIRYSGEVFRGDYTLSGPDVTANVWYHVAVILDQPKRRLSLYLDGREVAFAASDFTNHSANTSANVEIGTMTYVQHFGQFEQTFFHGQIDEIRIWNMARTPEEIKATMNRTLVGDEPGLVGYWNFDHDGAGDLSKNSNHGTLHGDAMIMESALPDTFIPATAVALEEKVINPRYQFPMNISIYLAAALHSFSVDVTFDPSVLQVLRVKEGPFLSGDGADATWWGKPEVDNKKGIITHIACRRARRSGTAADTGILATVMFKAIHAGESKVRVQNLRLLGPNGEAIASHGRAGSVNIYPMLLANLNQAAKAEKRGVLVCEGVFSINQSMARVKFIAAAVKTC